MTREEKKALRKAKKAEKKANHVSFWSDFKKFVTKGNVLDMAVAVVVATAFNAIVNGLVKYIITPAMSYFTSGVSINEWEYVLREEVLNAEGVAEVTKISIQYGLWLQAIIDFIIIAFSIFVVLRIIKKAERKINAKEIAIAEAAAAQKKAEDDAKAAEAQAVLDAEKAARDEFYSNIREIKELLKKD